MLNKINDLFRFKICLFLLIMLIYLLFVSGIPWVEATHQLQITRSFVQEGFLSTKEHIFPAQVMGRHNRWYDCHGITNVYLMLPIVIFGEFLNKIINKDTTQFMLFFTAITGVLVNALACLFFFLILLLFGRPLRASFYSAICLAFFTIVFPYASTNYEGNLNMLFILSSLYFLFTFREKKKLAYLMYSGMFAGLAINTREFSWLFLFCIITFIFWPALKEKKLKVAIVFCAALIPFLIMWGYYNWLRTGFFYLTPNIIKIFLQGKVSGLTPSYNILLGLKGLLLSKGASIFIYSPVLILSMFGWKEFFRQRKGECLLLLYIIFFFFLSNAKLPEWFGLYSWGPRYTLEMTPLLILPMGYWFSEGLGNKIKRRIFIIVSSYSLLIQLAGILTYWNARLPYLLERAGGQGKFFYTAKYSQWWDSIKILFINFGNLFFSPLLHLQIPEYDYMSEMSGYCSRTIMAWWNRLLYIGVNPILIAIFLGANLIAVFFLWDYLNKLLKRRIACL